ncbi:hypothetical protein, partial [Corynebacterium bovis]|uniref:hypothetical protein n=1 Tax=Corynebacterium bovis TaxID=36808 RepID=UPI001C88EE39
PRPHRPPPPGTPRSPTATTAAPEPGRPPLVVVTSPTDGATLEVQSEVDPGGSITVRGAGWGAGVTPAPVVTLKLNYTLPAPDGRSGQYSRSTGVLDHPVTGRPEPTIWQLVTVRPDGTFEATVDLPTDGGVPVVPGQKLTVNAAAGLTGPGADAARATRSLISAPVTVGGVPWVEPERPTVSCTPSTPETLVEVAHVPDAEGRLRVSGTGWCNPTHGGATIALKIDDGAFSRLPETKVHDNLTVWQIVKADLSGNWSVDIDLPDGTTAGPRGSNPALPPRRTLDPHPQRVAPAGRPHPDDPQPGAEEGGADELRRRRVQARLPARPGEPAQRPHRRDPARGHGDAPRER